VVIVLIGLLYVLFVNIINGTRWQPYLFLAVWAQLILSLTLIGAALDRSRYIMPLAAPLVLLSASTGVYLWHIWNRRLFMRLILLVALGLWLVGFAMPFTITSIQNPMNLPLTGTNLTDYLRGDVSADDIIPIIANRLKQTIGLDKIIYSDWKTCHLLFFFSNRVVHCLPREEGDVQEQIAHRATVDLKSNDMILLVSEGPITEITSAPNICTVLRERFVRRDAPPIDLMELSNGPCSFPTTTQITP
jgi:hypothetical protein